ncbi:Integrase, catalytic core [Gossypium australe]|uniref:Integrase, catalytic core n=1 Tax=Gossypium australe TaxID=47621 RepID=A0A5B6UYW9_9ROSI|nr:Integrase, catalytic core [Gossypium australe]
MILKNLSKATFYAKTSNNNDLLVVFLYVDDILVIRSNFELVQQFKDQMMMVFEIIDLREMSYFFRIEISQFK